MTSGKPAVRTTLRQCAICEVSSYGTRLVRFTLIRSTYDPTTQRSSSRGCGGIDLCRDCWERNAKRRRKAR